MPAGTPGGQAALDAAGPAAAPSGEAASRSRASTRYPNRIDDAKDAAARGHAGAGARGDALIADALICLCEYVKATGFHPGRAAARDRSPRPRARRAEDERLIAWALLARANTLPPGAEAAAEYHEAARRCAPPAIAGISCRWTTRPRTSAIVDGSYADAARLLDEALPLARASGDPWQPLVTSGNLGLVLLLTGDDAGAQLAFEEQLRLCRDNIRFGVAEGVGQARGDRRPPAAFRARRPSLRRGDRVRADRPSAPHGRARAAVLRHRARRARGPALGDAPCKGGAGSRSGTRSRRRSARLRILAPPRLTPAAGTGP